MKRMVSRVLLATTVLPALAAVSAVLLWDRWSGRLPDPVAIHWGPDGADGSAGVGTLTAATVSATAALALVGAGLAVTGLRRGLGVRRGLVVFHAWFATMPMLVLISSLSANLDALTWHQASGPVLPLGLLLAGSAATVGLAALAAPPSLPPTARGVPRPPAASSVGLASGQRAVWIGGTTNPAGTIGLLVAPMVVLWFTDTLAGANPRAVDYAILCALGLLVAAATCRLRVTIDGSGVTIRWGLVGWPRKHVPLADIASATTGEIGFFAWGGVGIRRHPVTGDVAYKVRGGPVLELNLRNGSRVLITVDRPDDGAGLLNDLARQEAPGRA